MIKRLRMYWSLFWHFRSLHLMRTVEYRANFWFWAVVSAIWTVIIFFMFALIANVNHGIAGWSEMEMYVLLSVFTVLDAFIWSFFYHNMTAYSEAVFNGQLNQFLTKPIDVQFMLMTRSNNYTNSFRLALGLALLAWSTSQLPQPPQWWQWVLFWGVLCLSLLLIYFIWFILTTAAFWVEKLDNINEVIPNVRRLWQVPRDVFSGSASVLITVVFALGLISSVPTEILVQKLSWPWIIYLGITTLITIALSRWFFLYSLRKYVGTAN